MDNWRVWDKIRCSLNKIGLVKKWLSRQLVLRERRHNGLCFISNSCSSYASSTIILGFVYYQIVVYY
ncbi:hypothetical protein HMPREF6745_2237 [Prevotella sp. oral taxon 472 str. F0295]|nr:hypothetical protein HMPREF6745_2237 [Prevotella sp. oral taxon 472 str. F0295]